MTPRIALWLLCVVDQQAHDERVLEIHKSDRPLFLDCVRRELAEAAGVDVAEWDAAKERSRPSTLRHRFEIAARMATFTDEERAAFDERQTAAHRKAQRQWWDEQDAALERLLAP